MKISILTLFPETIKAVFSESIIKRAIDKQLVEIEIINIRDFAIDSYGSVDDKPYGGGAGMVMRVDVVAKALEKATRIIDQKVNLARTIITTPKGTVFNQSLAEQYSKLNHLIIVCGHYEGIDERVSDLVDNEISLGDFVMTGGEITATAIVDSVIRLIPEVIKKDSPEDESFSNVSLTSLKEAVGEDDFIRSLEKSNITSIRLLEYPHYTRPEEYNGIKVPAVLLSGNHREIEKWRIRMAYEETKKRRPDLLIIK